MLVTWGMLALGRAYESAHKLVRKAGFASPAVVFLPPPAVNATFQAGVWQGLNARFGTLFDLAEEERVQSSEVLSAMAKELEHVAERAPDAKTRRALADASALVRSAITAGEEVVVSL